MGLANGWRRFGAWLGACAEPWIAVELVVLACLLGARYTPIRDFFFASSDDVFLSLYAMDELSYGRA